MCNLTLSDHYILLEVDLSLSLKVPKVFRCAAEVIYQTVIRGIFASMFLQVGIA